MYVFVIRHVGKIYKRGIFADFSLSSLQSSLDTVNCQLSSTNDNQHHRIPGLPAGTLQ